MLFMFGLLSYTWLVKFWFKNWNSISYADWALIPYGIVLYMYLREILNNDTYSIIKLEAKNNGREKK